MSKIIVMQTTIDGLIKENKVNQLNFLMEGDWEKKQTKDNLTYYKQNFEIV